MDSQQKNVSITMVRSDFINVPLYELPVGYLSRMYRDGDKQTWIDIHRAAEPYIDITPELFDKEFGSGADVLPQRMFFIETDDGRPAGSITAWWENKQHRLGERGRIHWVVVHPDHQGKGISKAMMSLAMETLSNDHQQAMLGTSSGRPIAVKVYLDFGFRPDDNESTNEEIVQAWRELNQQLHHPTLDEYLNNLP
jgi:GNAT superfamily N-acetyltransferase